MPSCRANGVACSTAAKSRQRTIADRIAVQGLRQPYAWRVPDDEERIALFLDYENLAIGARDALRGQAFDLRPVAEALAERGRVVVRRAYADWSYFDQDRRMLTRHHVELIEIPQRMGATRKNAADIKMAVDAIELCFERDYITTFVLGTGDSDFTPLVHKLRELNRRVIGFGVEASTSNLLPAACDEFLFYERLEGVEPLARRRRSSGSGRGRGRGRAVTETEVLDGADGPEGSEGSEGTELADGEAAATTGDEANGAGPRDLASFVIQTLGGMERSGSGPVRASMLKRAMLRKDSTFTEATYGFRAFGELLRHLAASGVVALADGSVDGDPEVGFPDAGPVEDAFDLLVDVVRRLSADGRTVPLSGLKTQLRKAKPEFSEKRYGYNGFLPFCRAAEARSLVSLAFEDDADDYLLTLPSERPVVVEAPVEELVVAPAPKRRTRKVAAPDPEPEPVVVSAPVAAESPVSEPAAAPKRRRTTKRTEAELVEAVVEAIAAEPAKPTRARRGTRKKSEEPVAG